MNSRSQLANNAFANNAEERCRLLSMMVPDSDALGNIVNRSDSQLICSIENLGYSVTALEVVTLTCLHLT